MADNREVQFQQDIIEAMTASGWLAGQASGYDRISALYPEDLLGYFREAYPERWEKFCKNTPQNPEATLIRSVVRELERHGTLEVLRRGVKVPGVKIDLCSFQPDHAMNPEALARYGMNRLRVVPEVAYSPHQRDNYNPRLDLVLFRQWYSHSNAGTQERVQAVGRECQAPVPSGSSDQGPYDAQDRAAVDV
ncbi:hypothetical protein [Kushneria phosphatilytica]|uniref:hypothetical protein n=1 Tax=Kushneria phosphatilytica TaxID=657387 RepID=UPI000A773780|nr:hypothetical protein [Kushneria phosphatilytica]